MSYTSMWNGMVVLDMNVALRAYSVQLEEGHAKGQGIA